MTAAQDREITTNSTSKNLRLVGVSVLIGITVYCVWWTATELERQQQSETPEAKAIELTKHQLRDIGHYCSAFKQSTGRYPHPQEFEFLVRRPENDLRRLDGWGRQVVYQPTERRDQVAIYSVGPNGVDESGTGDDIAVADATE